MKIKQSNPYGPATPEKIKRFEDEIGHTLPAAYKNFLLKHNGGEPDPDTADFQQNGKTFSSNVRQFCGLHTGKRSAQIRHVLKSYRGRFIEEAVPIAEDSNGNYFLLVCGGKNKGKVYFWDHEYEPDEPSFENMFPSAPSFSRFCKSLYEFELPGLAEIEKLVKKGKTNEVERLLDAGYDMEKKSEYGNTLMELAAIHNQVEIIQLLYDRGAKWRFALKYAKQNYEFFPEHKASVDLIQKLKRRKRSSSN